MRTLITFLSDFGSRDSYVAQVKGVILNACPDCVITDITHEIPAYGILSGAWLLSTTFSYFPKGTIHLAVVDPGVGTERALLLLRKNGHIFIGPDNGLFSFLFPAQEVSEITWRPEEIISSTFHARDLFAPLVIRALRDPSLENFAVPKHDPVYLDITSPQVVHVDTFGNIVTNIDCRFLQPGAEVIINGRHITRIVTTFSEIPPGELALYCGSASTVEIASSRLSAALLLDVMVGMPVLIR